MRCTALACLTVEDYTTVGGRPPSCVSCGGKEGVPPWEVAPDWHSAGAPCQQVMPGVRRLGVQL